MQGKLFVEPWGQNILIKQDDAEKEKKKGNIVLPGQQAAPNFGTVMAVGPGRKHANGQREAVCMQVGWRVIFPSYGATEVEIEGEKYLVIDENAVLAIFTKPADA